MATRSEQRLILGQVLGVPTKGVARHELQAQLNANPNAEALQAVVKQISRKVNGVKGKPATRVAKAVKAFVAAESK